MSLTLKRTCPFTLTIQCTMDPDPYSTQMYPDSTTTSAWTPISPGTILEDPFSHQAAILPNTTRSSSPPKRPRNAKNLSLNVPAGAAGTKNSTNNSFPTSAPASPFRSPRLPTRRPSNLTINVHSLHRHPSTPELHKVGTPIVMSPAPIASSAKQFPGLNVDVNHNSERPRTRHTDPTITTASYFDENVEREKAYPDGPRLILEPNIWLYAEPDLQLAKTYDLVVNVAREVTNPFIVNETTTSTTTLDSTDPSKLSPESDQETTPSPFSSFSSARSTSSPYASSTVSSGISISPKTNKAPSPTSPASYHYSNVEYMHIPWDHNSSLTQELPGIVDHILERSAQGKKVLVHCQCGVSRSATLVIALVMKKLGMGTHEAYAYVKSRSPWIGPNMSLIYQLTDYGRLCGNEKKSNVKPQQNSAPSTAPLESTESRRYKEDASILSPAVAKLRPGMGRTQSEDRQRYLDIEVERVTESISSPRFVVSDKESSKVESTIKEE